MRPNSKGINSNAMIIPAKDPRIAIDISTIAPIAACSVYTVPSIVYMEDTITPCALFTMSFSFMIMCWNTTRKFNIFSITVLLTPAILVLNEFINSLNLFTDSTIKFSVF